MLPWLCAASVAAAGVAGGVARARCWDAGGKGGGRGGGLGTPEGGGAQKRVPAPGGVGARTRLGAGRPPESRFPAAAAGDGGGKIARPAGVENVGAAGPAADIENRPRI